MGFMTFGSAICLRPSSSLSNRAQEAAVMHGADEAIQE
jgi:hypothetical protein